MAASETVRLRLQFDYPPPATPHCTVFWLLVDLNRCRVVTDLISLIRQRFGFSSGALLGLYLEGGLLPPAESVRLVRDNDCLSVKLEDRETLENLVVVSNGGDSPFIPRKAKKRAFKLVEDEDSELGYKCFRKHWKKQESNSQSEKALDLETKPVPDQTGRKKSKRKGKVAGSTAEEEEEESKKKPPKRKEKCDYKKQSRNSKSPKVQKGWSLQNCDLPRGSPRSSLAKARRKGGPSTEPRESPISASESESCQESASEDQDSVTVKGVNTVEKLSAELLKEGLATKTAAPNKPPFTFSPSRVKATKASSYSSESDEQCVVSKNASQGAADFIKTAGLFAGRGCPGPGLLLETPGAVGWKPSDSNKGRQVPAPSPAVSSSTSLGRGWGRGEDFLSWKGVRGRGMRGKGRGRGHAVSCILNKNLQCQKQQQLNEIVTNSSTIIQNPVEILKKDYNLLPLLAAAPQVGEKVAFKLLELTSDYSPHVSDYKGLPSPSPPVTHCVDQAGLDLTEIGLPLPPEEGKILSHNPETQQIDIEILSSLPALKEPGKFDLVYHNENGTETVEYAVTQERRITVLWKELIDPRLIIESSSNIPSA